MNKKLRQRLARLERATAPELKITRIEVVAAGSDADAAGFVMERQPGGTWLHRTMTQPQEGTAP